MGERKDREHPDWPSERVGAEKADAKKEEKEKKEKASKKKKEDEKKPKEEVQDKEHFKVDFLHAITIQRMEEEERKMAEEAEKEKENKNKKNSRAKTKKRPKKGEEENKGPVIDPAEVADESMKVNLNLLQKIRIDFSYGQIVKFLFINKDESAEVIQLPRPSPPKKVLEAQEASKKEAE